MVIPPAGSRGSKVVDFVGFLVVLLPDSLPVGVPVSLGSDAVLLSLLSPLLLSLLSLVLLSLLSLLLLLLLSLLLLSPVGLGAGVLAGASDLLLLLLLLSLLLLLLLSTGHAVSIHATIS